MKSEKALKTVTFIYIAFFTITIFLVILGVFFSSQHVYRYGNYDDFSEGWISDCGEVADLGDMERYAYVHTTVPKLDDDLVLLFHVKSMNVTVYVGEQKLYETENYNENLFGHTPGSYFVKIAIKESYAGQDIRIVPDSPYHDGSGRIKGMYLGDGIDILRDLVCGKLASFLLSLEIAVIGLALIVLYVIMQGLKLVSKNMLYLGLFAYSVGVYLTCDGWVLGLLLGHESFFHMVAELWMMLIPVPFVLYFASQYQVSRKWATIILCVMSLVDFVLSVLAHTLNIKDYHEMILMTHICFVVIILYFIYLTACNVVKGRMIQRHRVLGMLCIFIGTVLDIVLWRLGTASDGSMFTRLGTLLFLAFEGGQLITDMMGNYKNVFKSEFLRRLAYYDGLTDLLNRTSYKEDVEKLEQTRQCRLVAVFDVNDLKVVNDTLGHAKGDELIVIIASELQNAFSKAGKCYRIGGDEFVFLSNERCEQERFLELLAGFKERLVEIDATKEYVVSVACGYVLWEKQPSLKQVIHEADSKMYEEKKRMKKGDSYASDCFI